MTDCDGLASFAGAYDVLSDDPGAFVGNFSVLIPKNDLSSVAGIGWNDLPIFFGGSAGQISGFALQYRDGYGSTSGANNDDQGHHFAAFLQLGFNNSLIGGIAGTAYEHYEGTSDNQGDINLANFAANLGAQLKAGSIKPNQVDQIIKSKLCAN